MMVRAKWWMILLASVALVSQSGCFHARHCDLKLADDSAVACSGSPVTINVLGNDVLDKDQDGEEQLKSVSITEPPDATLGTAVINPDNTITFTPAAGATGQAKFEYRVCIESVPAATTTTTTTGGERCHHAPRHDNCCRHADVTVYLRDTDQAPTAGDDTASTPVNTPVNIDVLSNDSDPDSASPGGDTLTISAVSTPSNGTAAIITTATGQQVQYTPNTDVTGPDSFTYTVIDVCGMSATATVNITVEAAVTPPVLPNVTITTVTDPINAGSASSTSASGGGDPNLAISVVASDGTTTTPAQTTTSDGTTGAWSVSGIDVSGLLDGKITYTVTGTDASNQTANASLGATKDTVPPTIAITLVTDPIDGTNATATSASGTGDPSLSVSVVASDGTTDSSPQTTTSSATDGTWSVSNVDVSGLADGTITYTATGTNAAGNSAKATMTATKSTASGLAAAQSLAAANVAVPPAKVLLVNHSAFEIDLYVSGTLVNVVQPNGSTIVPDEVAAGKNQTVRIVALLPQPNEPRSTSVTLDLLSDKTYTITYTDDNVAVPSIAAVLSN
ncbi:MAG: cadherin-like domain-containing protein [Planctomycetia bacterium]|nr:cadherin-like domain-containing protein [Planctomycetia bacterium]